MIWKTKRLVAVAAAGVSALAVTPAGAQAPNAGAARPTPEQIKAARAKLEKELNITSAQRTKLNAIESKYQPQLAGYQKQLIKIQQQMQAVAVQAQKETLAVLTPEQREKLEKLQAAEREKLKKMYGNQAR
jgi:Spy/CpxP family protein refolding chaperone